MKKIKPIILRGQLQFDRAREILSTLGTDPLMVVEFKEYKENKTVAQIRTVHMWIEEVQTHYRESEGKFYTTKGLKIFFKELFGDVDTEETPTGIKTELKSFADYKQDRMSKFMEDMDHYCSSELRIYLTIPNVEAY